jgi:cytochrome bd-type quinol oxidase subunit 2
MVKMPKLKINLTTLILFLFVAPLTLTVPAMAADPNINGALCSGSDIEITANPGPHPCANANGAQGTANNLIRDVINILSSLVGALAVVMIIYAGFRYVTSGGSDDAVKSAKRTILYAVVGLIIVAISQIIVHFVLAKTKQATTPPPPPPPPGGFIQRETVSNS